MKRPLPENNFQKILGTTFLILVFLVVVSIIYFYQASNSSSVDPYYISKPKRLTYTNSEYDFSFIYSKKHNLSTAISSPNYFPKDGKTLVSVFLPNELFLNTNFVLGSFTVATIGKSTLEQCQTILNPTDKTSIMTNIFSHNSVQYYYDRFLGAAAGTKYSTRVYRHWTPNSICIEANITVGLGEISNYNPTVHALTESEIWDQLNPMLETLRFN